MRNVTYRGRLKKVGMPPSASAFVSNDEVLENALQMFRARLNYMRAESDTFSEDEQCPKAYAESTAWTKCWHSCFGGTDSSVSLCELSRKKRFNRTEREILVVLLLDRLGLLDEDASTCKDVLGMLNVPSHRTLDTLRYLSQRGRLYKAKLISYEDPDEDLRERTILVDPALVESILHKDVSSQDGWPVKSEQEVHEHLGRLTRLLSKKSDELDSVIKGYGAIGNVYKLNRRCDHLLRQLEQTLTRHTDWKLTQLQKDITHQPSWIMLLALVGKELGHVEPDNILFQGLGLACAVCGSPESVPTYIKNLTSSGYLITMGLIQPCGGDDTLITDDASALRETEFELTEKTIERLQLKRHITKKKDSAQGIREPRITFGQLVLSPKVRRVLDLAITHAKNSSTLMKDWGLSEFMPYGHGVTLLFSGSPGTGKTASAEALAHAIEKPFMSVDYSEIQNCFVGQTEKNIVKAFRTAKRAKAVLFWDEADAMFFDRDAADRNWEVRDVNVLLKELERFEGVCILATNRKVVLDKALERRITLKVEFERPDRNMRERIFKRMIPKRFPIEKDVDFHELSGEDMSGGEIKNVVLNAARIALQRNHGAGHVTMADFRKAMTLAAEGTWSQTPFHPIGFGGTS